MAPHTLLPTLALLACTLSASAQQVTRMWFTPPVVAEGLTKPVRFEATVTGKPSTVMFEARGIERPMTDDGKNGDLKAHDGTWTILLEPQEILSQNTPARVFRPALGHCKPAGGGAYNVIAEVWTPEIGLQASRPLERDAQETDYVVNFAATADQLLKFDAKVWAQRFFKRHRDTFDFLNFVLVSGPRGNRGHFSVRSDIRGISPSPHDSGAQYGSRNQLKGITVFPIPSFFDGGSKGFNHETGHQWVNFLRGTPFESGIPHWPKGDIAANVMGFSLPGQNSEGGDFPFSFKPDGTGGYSVGRVDPAEAETFNMMELYLMGLAASDEAGTYFVLKNQQQNLSPGQSLSATDVTKVTLKDVVSARGPRVPDSSRAQKNFRSATIVVSDGLLDAHALSFYDYFARRAEAKTPLPFSSGLASGTAQPWYLATRGRSEMSTRIAESR